MTDAEMWGVLAEAATLLDATDVDWRTLQQIEGMLSSLSTELERAVPAETPQARTWSSAPQADPDVRILCGSLSWVRTHEYVALESEIHQHLDIALRYALGLLDRLGRWQHETRLPAPRAVASGDGR
jgi:hypothetical protein